jgi:transposase
VIAVLQAELAAATAAIAAAVATAPEWATTRAVLASCPGIGPHTVALLLAALPEVGQRDATPLAALVGVAPVTQQRGRRRPTAASDGGRRHVRTGLGIPTLCALRGTPIIAAYARRLRARGTPSTVLVIACMRTLLTLLNAMGASGQMWAPDRHTA